MEFDIHIEKIGELDDIFGFYKYLVSRYDLKKHVLLESSSENTNETLYSFISLEPDFMLEINGKNHKILDVSTARGEKIKEYIETKDNSEERLEKILKVARGFIYLISVMGVTGARDTVAQITKDSITRMKQKTEKVLPVFVGFGISQPEHASTIIEAGADGVIIGSAIVNIIKKNLGNFEEMKTEMVKFVSSIKDTITRL